MAMASSIVTGMKPSLGYGAAEVLRSRQQQPQPQRQGTRRMAVLVRAQGTINPEIRKDEAKVVDSVLVSDLSKPLTAYCRCWRSGTFPLCDGSHVKHNKETGDNVGPLLLKTK
ncbi:Iron sulfur-containing domain CDGSH-type protein [Dioscorea alata]|uniref:Iron sulfur-containing domain CDGSH-type protein n=1 Tax=Dioscorea alata TaxID=55571 RepID=A0ACB7TZY0_DIOAL|nr:Iron sulfur-containing domain CDGSH-type protein [Dioscorea alata]